jgi:cell division protein FtsL
VAEPLDTASSATARVPSAARGPLLAGVLLLAIVASAVAVIYSAHRSRELFRELEQARRDENEIQIEWRQLLLERSTLSSHTRVETIAGSELQMTSPPPEMRTVVVQ